MQKYNPNRSVKYTMHKLQKGHYRTEMKKKYLQNTVHTVGKQHHFKNISTGPIPIGNSTVLKGQY